MSDIQKPSVGRIVHWYSSKDAPPYAAIVTFVHDDAVVDLQLFPPPSFNKVEGVRLGSAENVPFFFEPKAGHWTWPARV